MTQIVHKLQQSLTKLKFHTSTVSYWHFKTLLQNLLKISYFNLYTSSQMRAPIVNCLESFLRFNVSLT